MTNQEKIKNLRRYLVIEPEVKRLQEEIDRWRSHAEKTTSDIYALPGGQGTDRLQAAVDKIMDLETELTEQLDKAVDMRREIETAIRSVPDIRLQTLLRFRYIEGWTWERIAVELDLNYRWVLRLHGKALEELFTGHCKPHCPHDIIKLK